MQNMRCNRSTIETKKKIETYIAKVQTIILWKNDIHIVI